LHPLPGRNPRWQDANAKLCIRDLTAAAPQRPGLLGDGDPLLVDGPFRPPRHGSAYSLRPNFEEFRIIWRLVRRSPSQNDHPWTTPESFVRDFPRCVLQQFAHVWILPAREIASAGRLAPLQLKAWMHNPFHVRLRQIMPTPMANPTQNEEGCGREPIAVGNARGGR
jgi:hypothetical protein